MKRTLLKICIFVVIFSLFFSYAAMYANAVDPVSAATMANAFAQAVAAYGASQGVSMSFDVTDTDGIGEGIHDLWNQYADNANQGSQTGIIIPYADSAAVSLWNTTFKKIGDNLGIDLQAETVSMFDGFWNWLLSGPAEMTKVDNQYYEWTLVDGVASPISIFQKNSAYGPVPYLSDPAANESGYLSTMMFYYSSEGYPTYYCVYGYTGSSDIYAYHVGNNFYVVSDQPNITVRYYRKFFYDNQWSYQNQKQDYTLSAGDGGLYYSQRKFATSVKTWYVPEFDNTSDATSFFTSVFNGSVVLSGDDISVKPYPGIDDPSKVYIPNNADVNYTPIPASIPLDIPWNDTLFGDGTDSLTDAQAEAVTQVIDDSITSNPDKAIELADTSTPTPPAGSEVYIPFLPIALPNFNFSLSGIWHYVVEWVGTLGSWFTTMFAIWNTLPYAMIVPVYATLVVVIVLGVYKRFLT